MDIAIVMLVSALALALHVVLFVLIRRWMDRDLALSFAQGDPARQAYMLERLAAARRGGVSRRALPAWLEAQAAAWPRADGRASGQGAI